jgi:hypothetical protein
MTPTRLLANISCALVLASGVLAPPAAAQRLFRGDSALTVTITTNLKSFISERDSLKLAKHEGLLSYQDSSGATKSLPVTLRARGHFRRQARNCQFPPVLLDFKSADAKASLLSGLKQLKITTNCKPGNSEYEQYILQEYAVYRAYAALTDVSLRTRLARITYRDSLGKVAPITTWAFFGEVIEDLAQRSRQKVMKANGALFADLDQGPLAMVSVFEFFVGNTDWSVSGQHNIGLLADSTALKITPLAYDFDWTGAVDARYSFPDSRLPIKRVTERLYRGLCLTPALFTSTIDLFKARRPAIDGALTAIPALAPDRVKRMQGFYDEFWKRTADPRSLQSLQKEFSNDCQKQGN